MRATPSALLLLLFCTACKGSSSSDDACAVCQPTPSVCNGHAELCGRRYDEVTFAGTHDAYASRAYGYEAADQSRTLTEQLADGVRVLHFEMLPNLPDYDQALLCHSFCPLGQRPLADALAEVKAFLDAHPTEVLTLLTESSLLTTDVIAKGFDASGILPIVRTQPRGAPWPTLGEMIASGQRVVVFYADLSAAPQGGPSYAWMHDRFGFTWETPWDNEKVADFARCDADRGRRENPLYVVDTYLEDMPIQTPENAARVNANPFLMQRLAWCRKTTGARPNFAMVNYEEVGDVMRDVDVLNGFSAPDPPDAGDAPPSAFDGDHDAGASDAGADAGGADADAGDAATD